MTADDRNSRDARTVQRIRNVLGVHGQLHDHATEVQVSVENSAIVLRGQLPSTDLKQELVLAIRQAGVLSQISNQVQVGSF
ncbi:MAG: BON domain-containing protein [Pirellulales bacterium]|nr:BON domain-containing protein [Pirellulales bacterium]